jgi:hypothetical protein
VKPEQYKKATPIPAGALFTMTTGEYSDYCIEGVFRASAEIDADALLAQWFIDHPEQNEKYRFHEREFIVAHIHLFEPVECWEFHVGDYSSPNEHFVRKLEGVSP